MEVKPMNANNMNTITKRRALVAIWALAALALLPTTVFVHSGEEHVTGTVTKISDTSVTVKTTAGKAVEVGFDAKTTFAQAKKPVQKSDIKVGDRIVIHAGAHTVEIGAAHSQALEISRTPEPH
jgi:hypothetical protein